MELLSTEELVPVETVRSEDYKASWRETSFFNALSTKNSPPFYPGGGRNFNVAPYDQR